MTDPDIRVRLDRLRDAVTPLDTAPAAIERAVTRRRRRPVVIGGAMAGVASVAVAAAVLPGSLAGGPGSTASLTTSPPSPPYADLAPVELTGERLGDWVGAADVVVVVTTNDGATADVVDVSWRRTTAPDSPAGGFALDALGLDDDGTLELATAQGAPASVPLDDETDYLAALRWEQVRCDGQAPGWVLLGDDAVLPYDDAVLGSPQEGPLELDSPVTSAFAGLAATDVASTLDEIIAELDVPRARGLCQ